MKYKSVDPECLAPLLEKCRRGDQGAWALLVDQFQRLVYSIARRMRLPDEDCADVFQATFTLLYRSLDRIERAETLPKWIAVTASREALRARRVRRHPSIEDAGTLDDVVTREESDAEANAILSVQSEEIWDAVDRMGGRCGPLIKLLYDSGEPSYAEVSVRLGIAVGAIGPTRARCLDKLRKILEVEGFFD